MAFNYNHRRYKIIDGKLRKQFDHPAPDGWFVTKAEAWETWNAEVAVATETSQESPASVGYSKRRYRVVDGRLAKRWDADPTWFVTKDEAWAAHQAEVHAAEAADAQESPEAAPQPAPPESSPANAGDPAATPEPGEGAAPEPAAPEKVPGPVAEAPEPEPEPEPEAIEPPAATEPPPEPEPEPEPPDLAALQKVLRVPAVIKLTGLSRTTIFRKVRAGTFVAPLDLGNGHIGWRETQILAWQRAQPGASQAPEPEAT